MQRITWATIYCLIGAGLTTAAILLGDSIATDRTPLGLAGIATCLISLTGAHFTFQARWLKVRLVGVDSRMDRLRLDEVEVRKAQERIYKDEAALDLRRAFMTTEFQRATMSLEEDQRAGVEALEAAREEQEANAEEEKFLVALDAFERGYEMCLRGVAPDAPSNVVSFPRSPLRATTMGQGALYN